MISLPYFDTREYELLYISTFPKSDDLEQYVRELSEDFVIIPPTEDCSDHVKEFFKVCPLYRITLMENEVLISLFNGTSDSIFLSYKKK